MAEETGIAWCDSTFNPWIGCTKIGPGCDNCYAEADFGQRKKRAAWGPGQPRSRTAAENWKKPILWNKQHWAECPECGWRGHYGTPSHPVCGKCGASAVPARRRVFCSSLADVFDNEVDPQWRADLFELIESTPNLDWLLLTKRIGNADRMIKQARLAIVGSSRLVVPDVLPNLWLGATIVNQQEADRDIPKLLDIPAKVRFLSMEPLLGSVDLGLLGTLPKQSHPNYTLTHELLNWVIVGGESGPNARPMHPSWVSSLRDQCKAAGVPFLFKQWGEWAPHRVSAGGDEGGDLRRGHVRYLAGDGREPDGHFRKGDAAVARIGKKATGRLLDGVQHNAFPVVQS